MTEGVFNNMARTYKWPLSIDQGRIKLMKDTDENRMEATKQMIIQWILPNVSTNPYLLERGVTTPNFTFQVGYRIRERVRDRVMYIFRNIFQVRKRARLADIQFASRDDSSEIYCVIKYVDLEFSQTASLQFRLR